MKWPNFYFPPINLWSYPNMINEESNVTDILCRQHDDLDERLTYLEQRPVNDPYNPKNYKDVARGSNLFSLTT